MTGLAGAKEAVATHGRRRRWVLRSLGVAALGAASIAWQEERSHPEGVPQSTGDSNSTLLAFMAALFGHRLTAQDRADLTERLDLLQAHPTLGRDLHRLSGHLEFLAHARAGLALERCEAADQENIINEIMSINANSHVAHVLSRWSKSEESFYRMRWSAVSQLAWMYRHSPVPWRARGYRHWAGVRGEPAEVLLAGPAYP